MRRVFVLLALSPLLAGCPSSETVKVGAILPLTGSEGIYGQPIKNGIELAYQRIQADTEYPHQIELSVLDSGGDPEQAKQLATQAYSGGAVVVIGGVTSAEALQMVPVADQFDRILISPSASSPELTGVSKNFYRVFLSDSREGTTMATFAIQKLNVGKAVILAKQETYAKGIQVVFANEFERQGGSVLDLVEFPAGSSDFSGLVDRVLTLDPEAVYVAAFADDIARLITALRSRGYGKYIFTTSAFSSPDVIEQAGDPAEGVFLTQSVFEPDSEDPAVQTFVEAYREATGFAPDLYAAHGFDAMMVVAEAIRKSGPYASDFWKGISSLREYPGVTGTIQFDERGDVQKFPRVYVVDGANLVDYEAEVERRRRELLEKLRELERQQIQQRRSDGG